MKRKLRNHAAGSLLLFLLWAVPAMSQEVDTVKSVPGIEVSTSVDVAEVYIGDLITYTLSIVYDSTYELVPPPLGANLGAFDVKDYQPDISTTLPDGRIKSQTVFKLATFTTGDYVIPPMPVIFILPDSSRKLVLADPVPIKVLSLLTDTTDSLDIRPLKAQFEFRQAISRWYYVAGATLLSLLAGLTYWLYRRRRKIAEEPVDLRDPWEIAFERLALLQQKDLPAQESYKQYYVELTDIARDFLGRAYGVDVMEMTTVEFIDAFQTVELPEGLYDRVIEFLKHADLVKFARFTPQHEQTGDDFDLVHELVEQVRARCERRKALEQATGITGSDQPTSIAEGS